MLKMMGRGEEMRGKKGQNTGWSLTILEILIKYLWGGCKRGTDADALEVFIVNILYRVSRTLVSFLKYSGMEISVCKISVVIFF
jgi:hypothetical protein